MTKIINLLPWREKSAKRRLKHMSLQLIVLILLTSIGYVYCFEQQALLEQQTLIQRAKQEQIRLEQQALSQQIQHLQQHMVLPDTARLATADVLTMLNMLSSLPLEQGELTSLQLDNQVLLLQGQMEKQQAFEQLHQYLLAQPLFSRVELAEMRSESAQIVFEMTLTINKAS
ncbi:PilN domain-containing protein [Bisgaard Taxon 45]